MKCENVNFKFGLPICVSMNSFNNIQLFNRSLKMVWVIEGDLIIKERNFNSEEVEKNKINEGELYIINSYTPFKLIERAEKYIVIDFKKNELKKLTDDKFFDKIYRLDNEPEKIKHKTASLILSYLNYDYQLLEKIESELKDLLEIIKNNYCINNQRQDQFYKNQKNDIINKIIEKIEADYKKDLRLKELAAEFHYNSSYLSKKFKNKTGVNFKNYIDRLRLEEIIKKLLYTNKNMNQVALESGFSNVKSFYRVFNNHFKLTPVELKNNFHQLKTKVLKAEFNSLGWLIQYLNEVILTNTIKDENNILSREIKISNDSAESLNRIWQKLINAGTAQSILDSNLRKQIRKLQEEINFEYLRFEGIFNDDLEVCKGDSLANIHYNWKLVDNIFDFVLENNLNPFISLSFMPELLASSDQTMFHYQANFSPPAEIESWLDLVEAFIVHIINRYGIEEVREWYFQVWTEFPVQGMHWGGSLEEYCNFYAETAEKIKEISQALKVGPASENFYKENLPTVEFFNFAVENDLPLDFYNMNLYHNIIPEMEREVDLSQFYKESTLEDIKFKFQEKDYSLKSAREIKNILERYYPEAELFAPRWNVSWNAKELIHDTIFMADFILDNTLKLSEDINGLGYLNLSDLIAEWPINELPFFGGRGLMNTAGIKKAGYYAYVILSELGNNIIDRGDNYIVTSKGDDIQLLVYNYAYLNKSYQNADYSIIDEYNRYQVFENIGELNYSFKIKGLNGKYKISKYKIGRNSGSAYDHWLKMGAPPDLNNHEVEYLKSKSVPDLKIDYIDVEEQYKVEGNLKENSIEFYMFRKQFQI